MNRLFSTLLSLARMVGVRPTEHAAGHHAMRKEPPPEPPPPVIPEQGNSIPSFTERDLDILARTIWGEARGEGRDGMHAVANVIMNRYFAARTSPAKARQYGKTVAEICQKPWQFSAWNENDPNRAKALAVTTADKNFRIARELAELALRGQLPDITNGADHYHTGQVAPAWSRGVMEVASVGAHHFFRLG